MTITISSRTETLLREQAGRLGQNTDTLADTLLESVLREAAQDFEETCAAVSEALRGDPAEDFSFEEYRTQFEADRAARRSKQDAQREQAA